MSETASSAFDAALVALVAHLAASASDACATSLDLGGPTMPSPAVFGGLAALEALLNAHAALDDDATGDHGGDGSQAQAGVSSAHKSLLIDAFWRCQKGVDQLIGCILEGCEATAARRKGGGGGAGGGLVNVLAARSSEGPSTSTLSSNEQLILRINSIEALRAALDARPNGSGTAAAAAARVAATAVSKLDGQLETLVTAVARGAAEAMLNQSGLGEKLAALSTAEAQPQLKMADVIGLEPLALGAAMRGFYSVLFRHGDALLPNADLIEAPPVRRRTATLVAQTIASTHRHLHAMLSREGSGYEQPQKTILPHSPEEIDTLLGVNTAS